MESLTPLGLSGDLEKSKMSSTSPLRLKASLGETSASEEIPTPQKPAQLPRRACKRGLSFSVSDLHRVAKEQRMYINRSSNQSDLPRSDVELQYKSQSSPDLATLPSAARNIEKLPENYEMLAEFFNSLDSSIRLFRLKGILATFANICASIQHLTERRFTYRYLAQMKHILPEAISIKMVLLRDDVTCCMKPELQVSLQTDVVESNLELKGGSAHSALKKLFRVRLVQFAREHPEEDDIPEETLPHHTKSIMSAVSLESTPVKDILSSSRLMTTTPELKTPKRSNKQAIDDTPHKEPVKRTARIKLFPTPRKSMKSDGAEKNSENSPTDDDVLGFLPESLLQNIKDKEKKAMEERDANLAEARLRKKMIASLPRLFDFILLIFQSGNRSTITKQELVHKILSCNCSVVDRSEVEEQLELMEELVPDWIFKKAAATGDILYLVNKMSSSQEIRQRLAVAE